MKNTQNLPAASPPRSFPWSRASLAALTLLLSGLTAQAMQPLITDDTGTQGAGVQQIETAAARARQSTGPARQTGDSLSATYTYGLTDTVDVYAAPAFLRMQDDGRRTSGWGNGPGSQVALLRERGHRHQPRPQARVRRAREQPP